MTLKTLKKGHPRLFLTDAGLARLRKALADGGDPVLAKCYRDVLKQADGHCRKHVLQYRKIGPRLLRVSRKCVQRTYALGLAWRLTGEEKYAKRAVANLLAVCAFPDWNPSHFLDTAEMAHAVGVGYDWLFGYLDAETRETIKAGLIRNGLKRGIDAYEGKRRAWWTQSEYNWNQVCNGGLIVGALAIAESDPQYARKIVPRAVALLPKALASYAPDGAWGEGPGYWNYATSYTAYALAALQTALGTDFGLSRAPGLDRAGWFPLYTTGPTGLLLNFADSGERARRPSLPTLFWLARRFNEPRLAHAEHAMLAKRRADPRHLIWYVPPGKQPWLRGAARDRRFGGPVEVAVFRSAWDDPNALFVGVKAGYNQVNHGHLDLGNFELDALGVRWARDLGSDDYNLPGYWDRGREGGRRWSYYRLNSRSHNVPLLDGKNQRVAAKAKFLKFQSKPGSAFVLVDLTSAYAPAAAGVRRGVTLCSGRRAVLVQDEFQLARACEVTWGMTTDARITAKGPEALLAQDGAQLRVRILSPAGAAFSTASAQQKPPQRINKGVRRLLVRLKSAKGPLRVAVLFSPAWPDGKVAAEPKLRPLADW